MNHNSYDKEPTIKEGKIGSYYVCAIMEGNTVLRVVKELDLRVLGDQIDKEWLARLPELQVDNPEIFTWIDEMILKSLAEIGEPEKKNNIIEFYAYEQIGNCIGHVGALARVDFQ